MVCIVRTRQDQCGFSMQVKRLVVYLYMKHPFCFHTQKLSHKLRTRILFYYMHNLSVSAIHWGPIRCPVHIIIFIIHISGDATLTVGPDEKAGTCIINYAPSEINVVDMAKAFLI